MQERTHHLGITEIGSTPSTYFVIGKERSKELHHNLQHSGHSIFHSAGVSMNPSPKLADVALIRIEHNVSHTYTMNSFRGLSFLS